MVKHVNDWHGRHTSVLLPWPTKPYRRESFCSFHSLRVESYGHPRYEDVASLGRGTKNSWERTTAFFVIACSQTEVAHSIFWITWTNCCLDDCSCIYFVSTTVMRDQLGNSSMWRGQQLREIGHIGTGSSLNQRNITEADRRLSAALVLILTAHINISYTL